tara:strand:- start:444 stop:656 length:213 start_codon:yes stop_codon:yes gene_type:complete
MFKILKIFIIIYFSFLSNAHAYIDPGSGSILLQALIGGLAAAGASLAVYWAKLKNFILKFKKKNIKEDDK